TTLAALALTGCPGRSVVSLDAMDANDAVDAPLDGSPADAEVGTDAPPPPSRPASAPTIQWVDPFMGTGGQGFGTGSTFPGPQTPFGMARPGPDTMDPTGTPPFAHCSGFAYGDTWIQGFSVTRMNGTGIPEYGAIGLAPVIGLTPAQTRQAGYRSPYDHASERASPGYYRVRLADTGIDVELTATDHVALQRYTFPAASDGVVLLDLGHTIGAVVIQEAHLARDAGSGEITGSARFTGGYSERFGGMTVYFAARASRAFTGAGTWTNGTLSDGAMSADGTAIGAYLHFDTRTDASVTVAVGLSFTDVAHAQANLVAESPARDFDAARTAAEARWESALSVVRIEGRDENDFRTFYSALYHTLLMPTLATDVDGTYRGLDGGVHHADGYRYYTDFSLWDTYRTEHPLVNLLFPAYARDFARSLTAMAVQGGYVPRWPLGTGETGGMIGDSADIVLADSWLKGVRDFDLRAAYTVMRAQATAPAAPGIRIERAGLASYLSRGYISIEAAGTSVSNTLEYAYDDHALSVLADALGEHADAV
ncbi:MAG: GH92 family glycosyl hydrolase, partial [Deltaproteobacteria bacterium]